MSFTEPGSPARTVLLVRPRYATRLERWSRLTTEPLDLEYLAAVAAQEGWRVRLADGVVQPLSLARLARECQPDLVGITGYYPALPEMISLARQARRQWPHCVLAAGGVHAEVNPGDFEDDAFDVIVHSGGAETFRSLLRRLDRGEPPGLGRGIRGRVGTGQWHDYGRAVFDPSRLPRPDRSHLARHAAAFTYLHHGPVALVKTAYGCPFSCNFCYCRLLNDGRYLARDMADVVEEIADLDAPLVWITDDCFLFDRTRLLSFLHHLRLRGVHKQFIVYARAPSVVSLADDLPALRRAGVVEVIVGLEAVEQAALETYQKAASAEENLRCVELLLRANIRCTGLFIMPVSATLDDFRRLRRWIRRSGLRTWTLSIFTPYPGTEVYAQSLEALTTRDPRHWDLTHLVLPTTGMGRRRFLLEVALTQMGVCWHNRDLRRHMLWRKLRPRWRTP